MDGPNTGVYLIMTPNAKLSLGGDVVTLVTGDASALCLQRHLQ